MSITDVKIEKIRKALALLNPDDDDHWVPDGTPRTGVVQRIARDTTITRTEIGEAWPGFARVEVEPLGPPPEPQYEPDEVVDFGEPVSDFDFVTPAAPVTESPVESETATADVTAPDPPEPEAVLTHQECAQALLDLEGELHGLRHRVQLLTRQLIESETKARSAAIEFERGEYHPSAYELTRATIEENNAARFAAGPQSSRGTAWEYARKNMQYGGRRLVSVLDEAGNQTLARNVDGSLAVPVPRSKMRLNWTGTPQRQVSVPFGAPKAERKVTPLIHNKPITIHMQEPGKK